MAQHFPENLIGTYTQAWCRKCGRMTNHRIDRVATDSHAGHIGPCMEYATRELTQKQKSQKERLLQEAKRRHLQPQLFPPETTETDWNHGKPPAHILDPIWINGMWIERDAWE